MAPFCAVRPVEEIGREHLRLCVGLAASTPELQQATSTAARSLSTADMRRACSSKEDAANLIYATLETLLQGSPPGPAASYIFHASIFAAALYAEADEPLVPMAGESAADDLAEMMLMALQSENYGFILQGAGDMLDRFGDMLGQAYYKVLVRGFRLAAIKRGHRERSSAMENLDVETLLEAHRVEMRKLLALARQECASDQSRGKMLDLFEEML